MPYLFMLLLLIVSCEVDVPMLEDPPEYAAMVDKVNQLRAKGCKCGNKNMPSVSKVKWNDKLFQSAQSHADEMNEFKFFSHKSKAGEDVGVRVRKYKYNWAVVGENIAEGQSNFNEVMRDWLKSPSHCRMIMNPDVDEMGIGRSGDYWVQHFGKQKSR